MSWHEQLDHFYMKFFALLFFPFLLLQTALAQQTILWEVTDTILQKRSFLLGTHHHVGNSFVDSIPAIKKALLQSELAIFETIEDGTGFRNDIKKRPSSDAIEKALDTKDYAAIKKMAASWNIEVNKLSPIELLLKLHQTFILEKCGTVKATDTWDHFDNYLIDIAQKNNIPLLGLETDSMQLSMISQQHDYSDWKAAANDIGYWIEKLTSTETEFEECLLTKQYQQFLLEYSFEEACEDDMLVKQRNEAWMKTIPKLLSSNQCFIAVGFLHLTKNCGLLVQLQQQGFLVKPVPLLIQVGL